MIDFKNLLNLEYIIVLILSLVAFFISISFHEFAHGYIAYKLGDSTAKFSGRLTLNPVKHFDLYAILFFIVFRFGWAKGVPIDSRNFKNEKHGMVYSALAGPCTNVILAFIFLSVVRILVNVEFNSDITYNIAYYVVLFSWQMVQVNSMLAIFNLIPLPPLDGSKIFYAFLPDRLYFKILSYDRYMMIFSLILVYVGVLDKIVYTGVNNLISVLEKIVGVFL